MRLGGYTRKPTTEPATQRALIIGLVVVAHIGVLIWWNTRPADAEAGTGEMREYVTYYDIATFTASGPELVSPPPEAIDSASAQAADSAASAPR